MEQNDALLKRGLRLEYLTLGWNVAGSAIVLVAAVAARSVALAGFGLDSLIEIGASGVVIWQLRGRPGRARERTALRLIGGAFSALGLYVLVQSARSLLIREHAAPSPLGVVWLGLTLFVMLALAAGKASTGRQLHNQILQTEARVTLVDAYLAGCILTGVTLNAAFGWWWADPVASLTLVFYAIKEGVNAWKESCKVREPL